MATIQAKDAVLELSEDGVTWKTVVCEIGHTYNRERSTNSVETKCYGGVALVSVGASSGSIDFTGAFETSPSPTQVSANEINEYFEDATYLHFRLLVNGGTDRKRQGRAYITTLSEDAQTGDILQYSFTLTIDGDVTIV